MLTMVMWEQGKQWKRNMGKVIQGLVPIPSESKELRAIKQWGRKKRERYAELIKEGYSNEITYKVVEEHKGAVPEELQRKGK